MPSNIVIAQADAPAEAGIEAQVQEQVRDLVNEIQVSPDTTHVAGPISELGPSVFFLAVALVFCVKYYWSYRAKQDVQTTVRAALERGVPMTGELLDRIVESPVPKRSDLRRGAIWAAVGVGLALFGLVVDSDGDAARPMLAIGLVPFLLGAAYLVLWRLGDGKA
jgi:Domain of unknown function (DUF6249)